MYRRYGKRILDLIFAVLLVPFLFPIFLIVGVFIKLDDKGSILYTAKRLGKNGKNFKMYKFRSMKMNAPDLRNEDGSTFSSENDPRLTNIGKILRKTSVDELPQLINVLIGDMSFIGPRPDLPEQIVYYEKDEHARLSVAPGISGYNQAYFRNSTSWKQRIKNDVFYVENVSFLLDLKIVLKTIQSILFQKGIYSTNGDNKGVEKGA